MSKLDSIKSAFLNLQENGFNLTSHFAALGEEAIVEQLLKLGGKKEDAVYGFAFSGKCEQVNAYLKNYPEIAGYAVQGYARGGHSNEILALPNYKDYQKYRTVGLAQADDIDTVTRILNHDRGLFQHAIEGYAEGNHKTHLSSLLNGTSFYPYAIYYAARSGHIDLVSSLLNDDLLNSAVKGFSAGKHYEEAALLLERGASIAQCLSDLPINETEPYWALYYYVEKEAVANALLEQIQLRYSVVAQREFPSQIEDLKAMMTADKLNYMEAKNKGSSVGAKITLAYLVNIIKEEYEPLLSSPLSLGSAVGGGCP